MISKKSINKNTTENRNFKVASWTPLNDNIIHSYAIAEHDSKIELIKLGMLNWNTLNDDQFKEYYRQIFDKVQNRDLFDSSISGKLLPLTLNLCLESVWIATPTKSVLTQEKLKEVANKQKLNSKIPFSNIYNNRKFKYIVTSGNNSKLIRETMARRNWWIEVPKFNSIFNFKWQPFSDGIIFQDFYKEKVIKQALNHFEFHSALSEKSQLFNCFRSYCEFNKLNVFLTVPWTFFIEVNSIRPHAINSAVSDFVKVYHLLEENKWTIDDIYKSEIYKSEQEIDPKFVDVDLPLKPPPANGVTIPTKAYNFNFSKGLSMYSKLEMPLSHFEGKNFWILKATNLNRGRGIHVFNDIETLKSLIKQYWADESSDKYSLIHSKFSTDRLENTQWMGAIKQDFSITYNKMSENDTPRKKATNPLK